MPWFGLDLTKINQNPKKHLPLFFGFKERLVAPLFPPFPTLMLSLGTSWIISRAPHVAHYSRENSTSQLGS